ncbi:uncharacterized protein PHALS_15065 [Plasmopara halstedii]|uniref:Uncharacterized protein n=1 Tax=Plasmopara halstedii TaxID=4781 RepID=A0A0P1A7C7_PLAHL|nr:uncharacterized protein PHALS_15065 [Plasmopara halstedii]CEG36220.1 hypothetical protein PHALS_15065 [Plasmopara halstedii]|eukprot:XP_024572589.1 hypothetical protein PHALS_15065 [Plasmopara halstedii]
MQGLSRDDIGGSGEWHRLKSLGDVPDCCSIFKDFHSDQNRYLNVWIKSNKKVQLNQKAKRALSKPLFSLSRFAF